MAQLQNTTINDTGYIKVPSGTAAQGTGDVVQYFTSSGPATFNVPTGVTSVWVLAVAGGGGGGSFPTAYGGGGGGAGGFVEVPAFPVTPGGTVALSVGVGGAASQPQGGSGGDTTFGTLTAKGGGGGGTTATGTGLPGGSGGGACYAPGGPGTWAGGTATQPAQPAAANGTPLGGNGFGFPGGAGENTTGHGSGGGGAGGAGTALKNFLL